MWVWVCLCVCACVCVCVCGSLCECSVVGGGAERVRSSCFNGRLNSRSSHLLSAPNSICRVLKVKTLPQSTITPPSLPPSLYLSSPPGSRLPLCFPFIARLPFSLLLLCSPGSSPALPLFTPSLSSLVLPSLVLSLLSSRAQCLI